MDDIETRKNHVVKEKAFFTCSNIHVEHYKLLLNL